MMTPARTAIAAVLAGVLLTLSGCGMNVPGVDGDLLDDWQPIAAPKFELPTAGMCLDSSNKASYSPSSLLGTKVDCGKVHTLEVVLIGTVEGSGAQASDPPTAGSESGQAAYAACGKAVTDFVGADWHTGMLGINVQMPNRTPWTGGLRSWVCSVYSLGDALDSFATLSTATLKGSLTGDAPKATRCLDVNGTKGSDAWWESINTLTPIDCKLPHEAEFVGTVQVAVGVAALPAAEQLRKWTSERCWPVLAKFMGLTDAQLDSRTDLGIAWNGFDKEDWEAGERSQRCFALVDPGKKIRASIKGIGKKALPA